ncbi:MAG: aromatic amino acid ammonia-lyase [Actinomycetota bacterium]|nr:aromatic amino acid ammonia-lyase [Actinomycetota bacterium]
MVVIHRHDQLDFDTYWRVVEDYEAVELDGAALRHVDERRAAMERHLAAGAGAYGVNTGLGYFSDRMVAEQDQSEFQRSILVGRAVGIGPPLSERVVRATMLVRLIGFVGGYTGISAALCSFLADRLNDGWYPVVPASRPGTAGETTPLCHLFQTLIGEGEVLIEGRGVDAAEALAARGIEPYRLGAKEGLALINGAPLAPALAADLFRRCRRALDQATVLGALAAAVIAASWRPYSARVGQLKGDAGQQHVHAQLQLLARGGEPEPATHAGGSQAPVSIRVLPQVHGAAHDVLDHLGGQVERELRAVTDSPLYLDAADGEPEGFYPSGNFHAQALSLALDSSAIAMTQVASLSEKRLHRLLDSRFSGLPDQLVARHGHGDSGLVSLHKAVVGLGAENRLLSAPASVHAGDTSSGQEDFQAFTMLAADKLDRLLHNVEVSLAHELVAVRHAHQLAAISDPPRPAVPPRLTATMAAVVTGLPGIVADRSLAPDVESAIDLIRAGGLLSGLVAHAR